MSVIIFFRKLGTKRLDNLWSLLVVLSACEYGEIFNHVSRKLQGNLVVS